MSRCPFLSTHKNKVSCFKECAFYKCPDNKGVCPFKALAKNKFNRVNLSYRHSILDNSALSILEELYEENNYDKIFQV